MGGVDSYLSVQSRRSGAIKGEAIANGHTDEIIVVGWRWGMKCSSALGDSYSTVRCSMQELTVTKLLDAASTGLMSVLVRNDVLTEVKLALRRSGGEQEDYFGIKIANARLTSIQHSANAAGEVAETLTFEFTKVDAEYHKQSARGQRMGAQTFTYEVPHA